MAKAMARDIHAALYKQRELDQKPLYVATLRVALLRNTLAIAAFKSCVKLNLLSHQ